MYENVQKEKEVKFKFIIFFGGAWGDVQHIESDLLRETVT